MISVCHLPFVCSFSKMLIQNTLIFICSTPNKNYNNNNTGSSSRTNGISTNILKPCCACQTLDEFQRAPQIHNNMIIKFSNMLIGCISDNIIREFYLFGSYSHTRCRSCKQKKRTRSFRNERKTKKNKKNSYF